MPCRLLWLALAGLALVPAGCASGGRAGGERGGGGAGADFGPDRPAVVAPAQRTRAKPPLPR
jgi:hypothetical protein